MEKFKPGYEKRNGKEMRTYLTEVTLTHARTGICLKEKLNKKLDKSRKEGRKSIKRIHRKK